jgi:hypothetical protein
MNNNPKHWEWICNDCKYPFKTAEITTSPDCPQCHSLNVFRNIVRSDGGIGYEFLGLKCKDDSLRSKDKVRREIKIGIRRERDPKSNGRLVEENSLRDRDQNKYKEKIVDLKTGEVIRNCEESLSVHQGHGSAKDKTAEVKNISINVKSCAETVKEAIGTAKDIHHNDILGPYEAYVLIICEKIKEVGFNVFIRSDVPPDRCLDKCQSSIIFDCHLIKWHVGGSLIGLDLIWDVLHELGHAILGRPENSDLESPDYQCQAWEKGWEFIISQCPELSIQRPSFEARRNKCLETYKREWAKKHGNFFTPTSCF